MNGFWSHPAWCRLKARSSDVADLNERIDELDKLAAESDLIARLAVDPKAR